jgi:hypothetical protein
MCYTGVGHNDEGHMLYSPLPAAVVFVTQCCTGRDHLLYFHMTIQGAVSTDEEAEKEKEPGAEKGIAHCAGKKLASQRLARR